MQAELRLLQLTLLKTFHPEASSRRAWVGPVKHTTSTWVTQSRPGHGILAQDMRSRRMSWCVHARTLRLVCFSEVCHPFVFIYTSHLPSYSLLTFLYLALAHFLSATKSSDQLLSPFSVAFSPYHLQCPTFSPHIPCSSLVFPNNCPIALCTFVFTHQAPLHQAHSPPPELLPDSSHPKKGYQASGGIIDEISREHDRNLRRKEKKWPCGA